MKLPQTVISIFILLFLASQSRADVICEPKEPPLVSGVISPGDFDLLIDCLANFTEASLPAARSEEIAEPGLRLSKVGWVYFNTQGGDVNEAIKIGRFLRESLAEVVVSEKCLSSCFLSVVGAVKLLAGEPFGEVGIHRIYYPHEALITVDSHEYEVHYNQVKRGMSDYLRDLDVPQRYADLMFSVPSESIYYLTADDYLALSKRPAYDEWISSRCKKEAVERNDNSASLEGVRDFEKCADQIRWDKFRSTVEKHKHGSRQ